MRSVICILLCLLTHILWGHDFPREFGKLSQAEFDLNSYPADPEAEAVVLFDIGESEFVDVAGGYEIKFTRTKRIKIFNRSAFDQAEVVIPYYEDGFGKTEKVESIEAFTYIWDQKKLTKERLDPQSIYQEKLNNHWNAKKFTFPNLQEGAILEYRYVLITPFHFNLPDWTFQSKIPTYYSEYTVNMIPFYEYVYLVQGISRFDYQHSEISKQKRTWGSVTRSYGQNVGSGIEFQDYVHTYVLKDIPAFRDESFITSPNDFLIKMDFQLAKFHSPNGSTKEIISNWSEMNESLLKHENFGKYIQGCKKIAKKIFKEDIDLSNQTKERQVETIIKYLKTNYNWNGINAKYTSKSPRDVVQQKSGNSAELNLLLLAMLNQAEINAHPVIISTRNHGKLNIKYPFNHFFNYVIVLVNEANRFFADVTEPYLAYNRIPLRCINDVGLIVQEEDVEWTNLNNPLVSINNKQINLKINPEKLTADAFISMQLTEYESFQFRKRFLNDTTAIKQQLKNQNLMNIDLIRTINYDKLQSPYIITIKGQSEIEKIGQNIILSPFLNFQIKENKLKQKDRTYPVDFIYCNNESFQTNLEIPEGYKLSKIPQSYDLNNELAEIHLNYLMEDSEKAITIIANYCFKKPVYSPGEYSRIKSYMNLIVQKFNQQLLLEKI